MKYIILCLLTFSVQVATACDCDTKPTIADSYQYSDLIFVGEVTSIEPFDLTELESLYEISQFYTKQGLSFLSDSAGINTLKRITS